MEKKPKLDRQQYFELISKMIDDGVPRIEITRGIPDQYDVSERTVYRYYETVKENRDLQVYEINKQLNKLEVEKRVEARANGLKIRIDRLMELQNDYEEIQKIIDYGKTSVSTFHEGKLIEKERNLTKVEVVQMISSKLAIIKQIQAIEADALPVQHQISAEVTEVKPVKIMFTDYDDFEDLTDLDN